MGQSSPIQCKYCQSNCIKKGLYKKVQKYFCKACGKYQRGVYLYKLTGSSCFKDIIRFNNEGLGISSISRLINMPKTTVRRKILKIAEDIQPPVYTETNQKYEVDELQTFVIRNHTSCYTYVAYAINRVTKKIIDFVVGARTKVNINRVIQRLLLLQPKRIYTDGLNIYPSLIPAAIHHVQAYRINVIERNNFTIRDHVKRLSRKTICYTKSIAMLVACLKIYFWG